MSKDDKKKLLNNDSRISVTEDTTTTTSSSGESPRITLVNDMQSPTRIRSFSLPDAHASPNISTQPHDVIRVYNAPTSPSSPRNTYGNEISSSGNRNPINDHWARHKNYRDQRYSEYKKDADAVDESLKRSKTILENATESSDKAFRPQELKAETINFKMKTDELITTYEKSALDKEKQFLQVKHDLKKSESNFQKLEDSSNSWLSKFRTNVNETADSLDLVKIAANDRSETPFKPVNVTSWFDAFIEGLSTIWGITKTIAKWGFWITVTGFVAYGCWKLWESYKRLFLTAPAEISAAPRVTIQPVPIEEPNVTSRPSSPPVPGEPPVLGSPGSTAQNNDFISKTFKNEFSQRNT